jgi:hypothetical protein
MERAGQRNGNEELIDAADADGDGRVNGYHFSE